MNQLAQNLKNVQQNILQACKRAKRDPATVTLIAVSKTKPIALIEQAHQVGQVDFGENYVQEFAQKRDEISNEQIKWHFIGHLQSNKIKHVVGRVHLIHTVDSLKLATAINRLALQRGIVQHALVQVKLAKENEKHGIEPKTVSALLAACNDLPGLIITGLMTIGTFTTDPNETRVEFQSLRQLRDTLNTEKAYKHRLTELSMGMTSDYGIAIEEGATLVRVGRQIFGERQ